MIWVLLNLACKENRYDSLVSRAIASAWVVGPHGLEPWTKGL